MVLFASANGVNSLPFEPVPPVLLPVNGPGSLTVGFPWANGVALLQLKIN